MGAQIKSVSSLVLVVTVIFFLIAFGLAISAESRRSTASVGHDSIGSISFCVYSEDVSTGLAIGAFLFLLLAQGIIMGATKCLCCGAPLNAGGARNGSILFFIISWVCFAIAAICLIGGASRNAMHSKGIATAQADGPDCITLRKGVFGAAAAFTLFCMILSEAYYVAIVKAREGSWASFNPGLTMTEGGPWVGMASMQ